MMGCERWMVLGMMVMLPACGTVRYYGQAAAGQWEIVSKSRSIPVVLADPEVEGGIKKKLEGIQEFRRFATNELGLPGDESYGTYADLGREYVTWVVYAAPEFSLEAKRWWYPALGKLGYRGFFREDAARRLRSELEGQGYDVELAGVEAYSTLGWLHDPVLNGFIRHSEIAVAELIFHELTHRRLFRNGDTEFNEALATAVAEEGVKRWLKQGGRQDDLRRYEALLVRRNQFYDHIDATRVKLEALYASGLAEGEMRVRKRAILRDLQRDFRELRRKWGGRGLESWLQGDLNNAHLVSIITYQKKVPMFQRLLEESGGDIGMFFQRAATLEMDGGKAASSEP